MINLDIRPIFYIACANTSLFDLIQTLNCITHKKWIYIKLFSLTNVDSRNIFFLEEVYLENKTIYDEVILKLREFKNLLSINNINVYNKIIDYLISNDFKSLKKILILQ